LWLTGFSIAGGGSEMEIRGTTRNSETLPEYIRRLGREKIFQGRSFSALTMNRAESLTPPLATTTAKATPGAVPPAPSNSGPGSLPAATIDFVLSPTLAAAGNTGAKP
jgi:Tfp pilus assembly protein PilN